MTPAPRSPRSVLAAFGAMMLATLLAALDQTIVATALPQTSPTCRGSTACRGWSPPTW